jgi:hypothetical protein
VNYQANAKILHFLKYHVKVCKKKQQKTGVLGLLIGEADNYPHLTCDGVSNSPLFVTNMIKLSSQFVI